MFAHKAGKKVTMKPFILKLKEKMVGLLETYRQHQKARRTMNKLLSLSDRELNDMGITRGDIYSISHGETKDYRQGRTV